VHLATNVMISSDERKRFQKRRFWSAN